MSTSLKFIKYFSIVLGVGIGLLIAGVIYLNSKAEIDLSKTDKVVGTVIKAGVEIIRPWRWGSRFSTGPLWGFVFQLNDLDEPLGTYRPGDDYARLVREIKVGDTLTVYFSDNHIDKINIDVYQIEKNGRIVQDYQSYARNNRKAVVLSGLLAYCFLLYLIAKSRLRKYRLQNQPATSGC